MKENSIIFYVYLHLLAGEFKSPLSLFFLRFWQMFWKTVGEETGIHKSFFST